MYPNKTILIKNRANNGNQNDDDDDDDDLSTLSGSTCPVTSPFRSPSSKQRSFQYRSMNKNKLHAYIATPKHNRRNSIKMRQNDDIPHKNNVTPFDEVPASIKVNDDNDDVDVDAVSDRLEDSISETTPHCDWEIQANGIVEPTLTLPEKNSINENTKFEKSKQSAFSKPIISRSPFVSSVSNCARQTRLERLKRTHEAGKVAFNSSTENNRPENQFSRIGQSHKIVNEEKKRNEEDETTRSCSSELDQSLSRLERKLISAQSLLSLQRKVFEEDRARLVSPKTISKPMSNDDLDSNHEISEKSLLSPSISQGSFGTVTKIAQAPPSPGSSISGGTKTTVCTSTATPTGSGFSSISMSRVKERFHSGDRSLVNHLKELESPPANSYNECLHKISTETIKSMKNNNGTPMEPQPHNKYFVDSMADSDKMFQIIGDEEDGNNDTDTDVALHELDYSETNLRNSFDINEPPSLRRKASFSLLTDSTIAGTPGHFNGSELINEDNSNGASEPSHIPEDYPDPDLFLENPETESDTSSTAEEDVHTVQFSFSMSGKSLSALNRIVDKIKKDLMTLQQEDNSDVSFETSCALDGNNTVQSDSVISSGPLLTKCSVIYGKSRQNEENIWKTQNHESTPQGSIVDISASNLLDTPPSFILKNMRKTSASLKIPSKHRKKKTDREKNDIECQRLISQMTNIEQTKESTAYHARNRTNCNVQHNVIQSDVSVLSNPTSLILKDIRKATKTLQNSSKPPN